MNARWKIGGLATVVAAGCLAAVAPLAAQRATLTAADYARAERFLRPNVQNLVAGGVVTPNWLTDERFWFRDQTPAGTQIIVVDPAKKTQTPYPDCAAAGVDCRNEAQPIARGPGAAA